MIIENEEGRSEGSIQTSSSIRDRVYNALQNGLERDTGPKDINFYLLYFNIRLETIIDDYLPDYFRDRLFEKALSAIELSPEKTKVEIVRTDLYQKISQFKSFRNLILNVNKNFGGSTTEERVLEFTAKARIYNDLQSKLYYYKSFI